MTPDETSPRSCLGANAIVTLLLCGVAPRSGCIGSPAFLPTFEITELTALPAFSFLIKAKTRCSTILVTESVTLESVPIGIFE